MSLALYFAVSTRLRCRDQSNGRRKKPATSTRKPEPQQIILAHPGDAPHRQAAPVRPANPATLGRRPKLMGGEEAGRYGWSFHAAFLGGHGNLSVHPETSGDNSMSCTFSRHCRESGNPEPWHYLGVKAVQRCRFG
jgi:hypothetical protein